MKLLDFDGQDGTGGLRPSSKADCSVAGGKMTRWAELVGSAAATSDSAGN